MTASTQAQQSLHTGNQPLRLALMAFVVAVLVVVAFFDAIRSLVSVWETREEYSFGYIVPFVSAYLIWQRRELLGRVALQGSWFGLSLVLLALALLALGRTGMILTVSQYAFLLVILGLFLSIVGYRGFMLLAMPLAVLVFMVPLPAYVLQELSLKMQLWSSQFGVAMIRLFGISVYLEGNVIDLGSLKLQVVEACSGLRYLFPLLTLAFIAVCLFRAALWKRVLVVVSAIPITVLMNSARIALIGILCEFFGKSMAEGFLHDFEGWVVFMLSTGILLAEMAILVRVGSAKSSLREALCFDPGGDAPPAAPSRERSVPKSFVVAGAAIAVAALLALATPARESIVPARTPFAEFPLALGDWHGKPERIAPGALNMLKLDDYLLVDYLGGDPRERVNLYVSYYATQVNGVSAHSPRACIPGDGWEITDLKPHRLDSVTFSGEPVVVNRAVIRKGDVRQLVYYWFQQRGRITTDEYGAKLYILVDAVRRNRTDGAMVRLVSDFIPGDPDEFADRRLEQFAAIVVPEFERYIPE